MNLPKRQFIDGIMPRFVVHDHHATYLHGASAWNSKEAPGLPFRPF